MNPADATATPAANVDAFSATVLVAEDNAINREVCTEMLAAAGCSVVVAENGADALAQFERQKFDLVLMDWHMPVMDGIEATRAMRAAERARGETTRARVIAMTGNVMETDREACVQAGMDDFLPKPFTFSELIKMLGRWLPRTPA